MENTPKKRKQLRLKEFDYSQEGYYFITICTKNRLEILGKIKDNTNDKQFKNINIVGAGLVSAKKGEKNGKTSNSFCM